MPTAGGLVATIAFMEFNFSDDEKHRATLDLGEVVRALNFGGGLRIALKSRNAHPAE